MQGTLWHHCLKHLESEVPEQQFNTWVRPLQAVERDGELQLLAPNRFVVSWIEQNLFGRIEELVSADRKICVAFTPKVNEWNGNRSIELEINDFQAGAVAKLA